MVIMSQVNVVPNDFCVIILILELEHCFNMGLHVYTKWNL